MQDPFKVCIRVKPFDGRPRFLTQRMPRETLISVECPTQSLIQQDSIDQRTFAFDNVFNDAESTQQIYDANIQQIIFDCVSQGYNGTILAYGQTGSGKSYTMFGNLYDQSIHQEGIVSLVLQQLFQMNVKMCVSYLEIYNEQIRDLIGDQVLQLNEDPIKGVMVQDVVEMQVSSLEATKAIIHQGNQKRVMAATNANQASSRSHAIIQLFIQNAQFQCKLSLVDLAGSERGNVNEGSKGIRQIEGGNINKSLLALGNCINMLACDPQMKKFVPYRDSKLTRLLKDSLGGNTKTIMIGCVQQNLNCHEETINTLKYASRARAIKKKIVQNIRQEPYNNETIQLLQSEILNLRQELQHYSQQSDEEMEIRMNLKQIDHLQQANKEGLQYLLEQLSEQNGDQSRMKLDILEYERAIEENERIRQELMIQFNSKKNERNENSETEMLRKEVIFLRDQLKQKDQIIDQLRNENKLTRPHTSYQETDRPHKDSLQYCGSSNSMRQQSSRDEDQQLIQLNKARESFKLFRTKMINLREKIHLYLQNGTQLTQEQLKEIIDVMNELAQHKFKVSSADQDLILQFQELMKSLKQQQQSTQQANSRSRSLNPGIRGKVQSQHARKPLQTSNHSPLSRVIVNKQPQNRYKKECPTPVQSKQKFIMDYVKNEQVPIAFVQLGEFRQVIDDLNKNSRDDMIKRSFVQKYPFQSIQS